jgi:uncharacterized protein YgiM (DUF1202 family)
MRVRVALFAALAVITALAVLPPPPCLAQDEGEQTATVTASTLNMRASPSASSDVVGKLKKGDNLVVLGEDGEWLRVRSAAGETGWISSKYVSRHTVTRREDPVVTRTVIREQRPSKVGTGLDGGLIGGMVFASFGGADAGSTFSSRTGYTAGLVVTAAITPIIGIQAQLMYVMKGAIDESWDIKKTYRLDYIELPLMLRGSLDIGMPVIPYVTGGGYAAYKLQAVRQTDAASSQEEDLTDIPNLDVGLCAGGGVRWRLGDYMLMLNLRYAASLQKIRDAAGAPDLRQRDLTVELGVVW